MHRRRLLLAVLVLTVVLHCLCRRDVLSARVVDILSAVEMRGWLKDNWIELTIILAFVIMLIIRTVWIFG